MTVAHTVQKVHWKVFRGTFRPAFSFMSLGTARLLRLLRPLCWRDPIELLEPWEYAEAKDADDGEVPKLLADDPLLERAASSSVILKGLLRRYSWAAAGSACMMAEAMAVTLAGSFSMRPLAFS